MFTDQDVLIMSSVRIYINHYILLISILIIDEKPDNCYMLFVYLHTGSMIGYNSIAEDHSFHQTAVTSWTLYWI